MVADSRFDVVGQLASLRDYARSLTRDGADAEDLVQETLARAYEKRHTFQAGRSTRSWLLSVLHNLFVDGARRRGTEALRVARAAELVDDQAQPPQEHAVRLAQVRQAFMALPEEQRTALHLVAIEGLAYQEAAAALGIPSGTLMSRLARARAALRSIEDGGTAQHADRRAAGPLRVVGGSDDAAR